ncbi:MAG TPA: putative toxin-antitoxin system toxin component, PIN family [Pyrinomonadaceae bacterium]|nr:putative toxin-antitoxin system toxin component, PIN family [Pyrinomonadaceae bacterium]
MRITADTNTVISALLWRGNPRRILDAARDGIIELYTTNELLAELEGVLSRSRFTRHLEAAGVNVRDLVYGYAALADLVESATIEAVVLRDPDDDAVIACAVAAESDAIVTGDDDLLSLVQYGAIRMLSAAQVVAELDL